MSAARKAGKLRFRDLPYDEEMLESVQREVEHFRDRCEVLIVLGIGGSALGNIALHSALNPYTYNLHSDRTRRAAVVRAGQRGSGPDQGGRRATSRRRSRRRSST
jgi:glucose-6-phosphate isomerase